MNTSITVSSTQAFAPGDVGRLVCVGDNPTFVLFGYAFFFSWPFYIMPHWMTLWFLWRQYRYLFFFRRWESRLVLLSRIRLSDEVPYLVVKRYNPNHGVFKIVSIDSGSQMTIEPLEDDS